ncbi:hypothetical protein AN1V17_16680 [Vallitalea sediminicola]
MIKKIKISVILLIIALVIIGCSKIAGIEKGTVKVTRSDLFEGESKKLKPHMGLISGCVKVKYKGDKKFISCKYEIWENGETTETSGLFSKSIDGEFDGEVSISLKELINNDLEISEDMIMTTAIGNESGYSSNRRYIKRFDKEYGYSPYDLTEEIIETDEAEIDVWGLMANGDEVYNPKGSIEKTAKEVDWAIVLKIYFKD